MNDSAAPNIFKGWWDDLYRVLGLIERAETFLDWAIELSSIYQQELDQASSKSDYGVDPRSKLIVIHTNLLVQDAVLCMHAALYGNSEGNDDDEISIPFLLRMYPEEIKHDSPELETFLKRSRSSAEAVGLHSLRHDILAHKNRNRSGDPITMFLNRIRVELLQSLKEIITDIKTPFFEFDIPVNNGFNEYYNEAHEYFIDSFKKPKGI